MAGPIPAVTQVRRGGCGPVCREVHCLVHHAGGDHCCERPCGDERIDVPGERDEREAGAGGEEAVDLDGAEAAHREADVAEQVQRSTSAQRRRRDEVERIADVGERRLQAEGAGHDPGHRRKCKYE